MERILAPSNIENYQTMLEATDESKHDLANSLPEYCQFCLVTWCPLETVYVSATIVSSPHLNRLRRKKESYFKDGQKHHLNYINEQIRDEIKRFIMVWLEDPSLYFMEFLWCSSEMCLMETPYAKYDKLTKVAKKYCSHYDKTSENCGSLRLEENARKHTANQRKTTFLHLIVRLVATHLIVPTRLQTLCIHFVLYIAS